MKILCISDDHGRFDLVEKVLAKEEYDFSIHLGDSGQSEDVIKKSFDKYVGGNHDHFIINEDVFELGGLVIGITHGHLVGISALSPVKSAVKWAKNIKADVIIHGHIHIPQDNILEDVRVICPGSIAEGRSGDGDTYAIVEIDNRVVKSVVFKTIF